MRSAMLRIATVGLATAAAVAFAGEDVRYPETKTVDQVDTYHGVEVADPFRWLEDDVRQSAEVADWVRRENEVTFAYLKDIPERAAIKDRLETLFDYARYSAPRKVADFYVFSKNDGLQDQSVVYTQPTLDGALEVLLDPNGWSEDGTVALSGLSFSDDGRYAAFGKSEAGSDWKRWGVLDMATRQPLADELRWIKYGGVSWTNDGAGFFYNRYPEPKEGDEFQALTLNMQVYYHRVGTPQSADVLVYSRPDHPEWNFYPSVSEDGRYLIVTVSVGTDNRYRILYRDLTEPFAQPVVLIDRFENDYSFVGNDGPKFYFFTDRDAPKGRLIAIDVRKPEPEHWDELIAENDNVLNGVSLVGNVFVCNYLKDVTTQVKIFDLDGQFVRDVEFPTLGTAGGFGGKRTQTETFYTFTSFAAPPSIYRYDLLTGQSTLFRRAEVDFDPDAYTVEQVFYPSKDGTRIPMFLVYRKGLRKDGASPTILYGYGGFNISLLPSFSVSRIPWLEMGGVYAVANLRGGGEYGKDWHQAGTKLNKQNVFDDFIAAAEYLIDQQYTRPEKLAIQGGSNGGLLVGAAMTQRPDLFGAALPAVGVMDMLRFHQFTAGRFWTDDYGSADDADEFKTLFGYSPYHNLVDGTAYPATLVTTADTDDRVVPGHSFKFAARLQQAHRGDAPVLIRVETRAGHGAGKPVSKAIEEVADQYGFLVRVLGVQGAAQALGATAAE